VLIRYAEYIKGMIDLTYIRIRRVVPVAPKEITVTFQYDPETYKQLEESSKEAPDITEKDVICIAKANIIALVYYYYRDLIPLLPKMLYTREEI